jgi:hypothetical protein
MNACILHVHCIILRFKNGETTRSNEMQNRWVGFKITSIDLF